MDTKMATIPSAPATSSGLQRWLKQRGMEGQAVELRQVGVEGRGLVATRRIRAGECLLQVPRAAVIDAETAVEKSALARRVREQDGDEWAVMATYLAEAKARSQRGKPTECEPYLQALPKSTGCVFEWTEKEVQTLLRGSCVQDDAKMLQKQLQEAVGMVLEAAKSGGEEAEVKLDAKGITWAYSQLLSRMVRLETNENLLSLVPWADMLNHSTSSNAHIDWDPQSKTVVLRTDREYDEGEQVYASYGNRSSGELLLSYGFVPALGTNPYDMAKLQLRVDPRDPMAETKEALLEELGLGFEESFPVRIDGVPDVLLKYARLVAARGESSEDIAALGKRLLLETGDKPVPVDLEIQARRLLVEACQKALKGYPKTMEEDRQAMKTFGDVEEESAVAETPPGRVSAAAALRVRERQILNRTEFALRDQMRLLKAEGVAKPRGNPVQGFLGRFFQ